jgi:hypothetical protein
MTVLNDHPRRLCSLAALVNTDFTDVALTIIFHVRYRRKLEFAGAILSCRMNLMPLAYRPERRPLSRPRLNGL